jgi:uncharacterized iron-regulated membrane protein
VDRAGGAGGVGRALPAVLRDGGCLVLAPVRLAVAAYTGAAMIAIAAIGWMGYRDHRRGSGEPPHDADSPEDRHRFLGFSTLLLAGLSLIATLYTALVALFFSTCQ